MEQNKRLCKECKQLKERILQGKFTNGRDKKWTDETGKLWNGNVCPPCNVSRAKVTMKRIRAENA